MTSCPIWDFSKLELNLSSGLGLTFLNGHEEHFNSIVSSKYCTFEFGLFVLKAQASICTTGMIHH